MGMKRIQPSDDFNQRVQSGRSTAAQEQVLAADKAGEIARQIPISSRRARALFCSECRQLSKYRTVSNYAWLFPSSTLSLDVRLPCVKATGMF